jgi:hypothetical protein
LSSFNRPPFPFDSHSLFYLGNEEEEEEEKEKKKKKNTQQRK